MGVSFLEGMLMFVVQGNQSGADFGPGSSADSSQGQGQIL